MRKYVYELRTSGNDFEDSNYAGLFTTKESAIAAWQERYDYLPARVVRHKLNPSLVEPALFVVAYIRPGAGDASVQVVDESEDES